MNKPLRKFQGVWIPRELWLYSGLSLQQKICFVEIQSLDNNDGCFATNQHFALFLGLSNSRARRVIDSLVDLGIIERLMGPVVVGRNTFSRVLKVKSTPWLKTATPMAENSHPPMAENSHPPMAENSHHNNTEYNNTDITHTSAWDFLKINSQITLDSWVKNNQKDISNWDDFLGHFNDSVDQEELEFKPKILLARLRKLKRNWKSGNNFSKNADITPSLNRLN